MVEVLLGHIDGLAHERILQIHHGGGAIALGIVAGGIVGTGDIAGLGGRRGALVGLISLARLLLGPVENDRLATSAQYRDDRYVITLAAVNEQGDDKSVLDGRLVLADHATTAEDEVGATENSHIRGII